MQIEKKEVKSMKKIGYVSPEVELILFCDSDIVTESPSDDEEDWSQGIY